MILVCCGDTSIYLGFISSPAAPDYNFKANDSHAQIKLKHFSTPGYCRLSAVSISDFHSIHSIHIVILEMRTPAASSNLLIPVSSSSPLSVSSEYDTCSSCLSQ